jgi:two-component system sensor histidine kinase CpxA
MSRIYFAVLAWLLIAVVITGVGFVWITSRGSPAGAGPPHRRLMTAEVERMQRLHEEGKSAQLREEVNSFRDAGVEVDFTDAQGRSLTGSGDYSSLVTRLERRIVTRPPILHNGRLFWAVNSNDGNYWLLLEASDRPPGWFWTAVRANAWLIGSLALFSLWLAWHITNPIRKLGKVVEQFGRGELSVRVGSARRDELGDLSRSFDQMAGRIEQLVTSQRRLLTDLSHELRTPLTRLGLAVELARSAGGGSAALDRVQKEADRLNDLVGGLLQVTRGESDPAAIEMADVRLDDLVGDIVEESRLEAGQTRIELAAPAPVTVRGNAELLRRSVENVLRNAIRYSPPGEVIDVHVDGPAVTIRDRGPGVPAESLPHLFDAFYRVDTPEETAAPRGFGLGLSIARRAVELHGGSISAANASPGLQVTIRLR